MGPTKYRQEWKDVFYIPLWNTQFPKVLFRNFTFHFDVGQEIPRLIWSPEFHYKVHRSAQLDVNSEAAESRPQPHTLKPISILSFYLRRGLPSDVFLSCFPTKILCTFVVLPVRAMCLSHLILLYFMILIICSLLDRLITSSLLGPNVLCSFVLQYRHYMFFPCGGSMIKFKLLSVLQVFKLSRRLNLM
jgi:hypothetical protein